MTAIRHDKLPEDASPVSVSQAGLIRLAGPARVIALDVLRINSAPGYGCKRLGKFIRVRICRHESH